MAVIILDPQEEFEHIHSSESVTTILSGSVLLTIDSKQFKPKINEEVVIPENVTHKLKNIGNTKAEIGCHCQPTIIPPDPPPKPPDSPPKPPGSSEPT